MENEASEGLERDQAVERPYFKVLVVLLVALVGVSLAILVWLAPSADPTGFQENLFETADWAFKFSLGSLIGLFTGKSL